MFIAEAERLRDDFSQAGSKYGGLRLYRVGERQGSVFNCDPAGVHARKVTRAQFAYLPSAQGDSSRTNADDRLPRASLGRVEGGDGIVEGCDVADVRPQSSVPHPLDDLTQLGTIGLDNEVDSQSVDGPRLGRPNNRHQYSSGSNLACGPLPDVAADDIEHQIDSTDVFQGVVLEIDKLLRTEVERFLAVGGRSGADDVGAELTCELRYHRTDRAGCTVHEDALPRVKAAMIEQSCHAVRP